VQFSVLHSTKVEALKGKIGLLVGMSVKSMRKSPQKVEEK